MRVSLTIFALSTFFLVHCSDGEDPDSGTTTDLGADAGVGDADAGPDTDGGDAALDAQPDGGPDAQPDGGPDADADSGEDGSVDASDVGEADSGSMDLGTLDSGGIGGSAACLGIGSVGATIELTLDWYGVPSEPGSDTRLSGVSGDGLVLLYQTQHPQFIPFANHGGSAPTVVTIEPSRRHLAWSPGSIVDPTGNFIADGRFVYDRRAANTISYCVDPTGAPANAPCTAAGLSEAGGKIAFLSSASNLVAGGTGHIAVYVRDLVLGTTVRVSHPIAGVPTSPPEAPVLSQNGRVVLFRSSSANLVANDTNGAADLFAFDLVSMTRTRVNTDAAGAEANSAASRRYAIAADGTLVAFHSAANNLVGSDNDGAPNVFIKDLGSGAIERLPPASLPSIECNLYDLSADGRYITWCDDAQGGQTVVYDRVQGGEVARVAGPSISVLDAVVTDDGTTLIRQVEHSVLATALASAEGAPPISCPGLLGDQPADWQWKSAGVPPFFYDWAGPTITRAGSQVVFWGGRLGSSAPLSYDLTTRGWAALVIPGATNPGTGHSATWTGTALVILGGSLEAPPISVDPVALTTTPLSTAGAPTPRTNSATVWTGSEVIYFGGRAGGQVLGEGGAYNPALDQWRALSMANAPSPRADFSYAWNGARLLVFGGMDTNGGALGDGAAYDPAFDQWTPISATGAPTGAQSGVWTGTEFFVWNGSAGGRYDPILDQWRAVAGGGPVGTSPGGGPVRRTNFDYVVRGDWVVVFSSVEVAAYSLLSDQWAELPLPSSHTPEDERPLRAVDLGDDALIWSVDFARFGPVP